MSEDNLIQQEFGISIYKNLSGTENRDFVIFDESKRFIYRDIPLVKVFEILKNKNEVEFAKQFLPKELFEGSSTSKEEYFKQKLNESQRLYIKTKLIENQKTAFKTFRMYVMLNCELIDGYTFQPISQRIIKQNNCNLLNMTIQKQRFKGLKPDIKKIDSFPHLKVLTENILQEGYSHFMKFLAWKLQFPLEVIPCHWIIQDNGGTGKTDILASRILENLFTVSIIGQEELHSAFSGYLNSSSLVVAEEIEGYDNEKKIKMLTGAKYIIVNEKFKPEYKITNYNNWILFSNDIRPLKISKDDRRFNVVGQGMRLIPTSNGDWKNCFFKSKEESVKFFNELHKHFDSEMKSMYQYLMALPVTRMEVQQPIHTKMKQDLEEINYTSEQEFFYELKAIELENMIKQYYNRNIDHFLSNGIIRREEEKVVSNWIRFAFWRVQSNFT